MYNKQSVDNTLADYNKNVMIGASNTEAYYKIENFLNRTLLLTDSLGNVWLLTGNSGGIVITKIAHRNTTTEIFNYDAEKKILYIKVLQGYGFYISIIANVAGSLRVSRSTDGTEFAATTNVITEVNLITR